MKPHEFLDDDCRDQLAQFVLGTLPETDSRVWSLHLTGCAVCRREVDELLSVVRALGVLGPRRELSPELWTRIQRQIRTKSEAKGQAEGETVGETGAGASRERSPISKLLEEGSTEDAVPRSKLIRGGDESWRPTGVPGIEVRTLHVDRAQDRATMLARMAPGSAYPAHVHAGPEECFVVQGDLWEGDRRMSAGDYERAPGGSHHEIQTTRDGCLLLLVSSLGDRAI